MPSTLRQNTRWIFGLLCLSLLLLPSRASAQSPVPTLSITAINVPPSDPAHVTSSEGHTLTFRMLLNAPAAHDVSLNYVTNYGTAFGGSDYVSLNGVANIPAGAVHFDLDLEILDELVAEQEETFTLDFTNLNGAVLVTPYQITIHIRANDEIGFNGFPGNFPSVDENAGSKRIYITYNGSSTATVNYAVTAGTATAGSDFTPISGSVSFDSGFYFREIYIPIIEDGLNEGPETVVVTLSNPQGASLGAQSSYTFTIQPNDLLGFTTTAATVYENSGQAKVYVRLNAPSAQEVRVNYATVGDTAQSVLDYTHVSGTLVFAPGETQKTVTIPLTIDGQNGEAAETFAVVLSSAVNAQYTKTSSRVFVTIYDFCNAGTCNE